jgi:hypothetical protein
MSDRAREGLEQAFLEVLAARHPGVVWEIERPEGDTRPGPGRSAGPSPRRKMTTRSPMGCRPLRRKMESSAPFNSFCFSTTARSGQTSRRFAAKRHVRRGQSLSRCLRVPVRGLNGGGTLLQPFDVPIDAERLADPFVVAVRGKVALLLLDRVLERGELHADQSTACGDLVADLEQERSTCGSMTCASVEARSSQMPEACSPRQRYIRARSPLRSVILSGFIRYRQPAQRSSPQAARVRPLRTDAMPRATCAASHVARSIRGSCA